MLFKSEAVFSSALRMREGSGLTLESFRPIVRG